MCPLWGAEAAIVPDCAGPVEISAAHVMRVETNGALILREELGDERFVEYVDVY